MSILKKGLKAVKKVVKGAVKFVKKHWKAIVIVGLVVFTMGIATVGFAGFAGAMSAASAGGASGFGAFMSAVGSTMYAGVTAGLGTLGIGSGAAGSAAAAGGVEGVGLFGGHLAAALGSNSAQAGIAAQTAASAGAPSAGVTLAGLGAPASATTAPLMSGPAVGAVPAPGASLITPAVTGGPAAAPAASAGLFGGDLAKAALITTGGNAIAGWAAGKAAEEDDPLGYWGVDLTGKGGDVAPPVFQPPAAPNLYPSAAQAPQVMAPMPPVPGLMNVQPQSPYPVDQWGQPYAPGAGG